MAEGMLGGVLGDEDEEPGAETPEPLAGAEAFAAAVAAIASRQDPEVARKTVEFLTDQSQLLRVQKRHLEDEHALRVAHLRNQLREERVRRFGLRLRVGFQLFIALVATVIGIGAVIMIRDAIEDHGLVVEEFSVPPDFAGKGLTGRVVASDLLDEIGDIQSRASSGRALTTYKNNWGGDIKVGVPETGVSIGELSRTLHERLGHATRVEGNVIRTAAGIKITARIDGHSAVHASGSETELRDLLNQIALGVFADTQPYRYAIWLRDQERRQESVAAFRKLAEDGPVEERGWGWNGLGLSEDRFEDRLADFRRALHADPDLVMAHFNLARAAMGMGLDEVALGAARAGAKANSGPGRAKLKPYAAQVDDQRFNIVVAVELGDHFGAVRSAQALMALPRWGGSKEEAREFEAQESVLNHDLQNVAVASSPSDLQATRAGNDLVKHFGRDEVYVVVTKLLLSAENGAWKQVVSDGEELRAAIDAEPFFPYVRQQVPRRLFPILALAYEHVGRRGNADALAKDIPVDVYDGWRARGRIALLRLDYPAAEKAFAEAVRLAPSLPRAYGDWGDVLAARNDLEGALAKYAEAHERGPRFADPLKSWGDLLAKQGHTKEAIAKYDAALKFAPNWKQLTEAREAAAKHKT